MNNYEIADYFSLLSKLMDIHGENSFKSKSYSIAAYNIEKLPREITDMDDAELFSQKGIGDSTGKKIREIQNTGKLDALEAILVKTPAGILEMLNVKGLGPKKIALIWNEMSIESIGELEYACNENRLAAVKGFGAKTQDSILQSIAYIRQNQGFHLWASVDAIGKHLVEQLQKSFPESKFALTGDIRRQSDTLEFVEIVTDLDINTLQQQFQPIPNTVVETEPNNRLLVRMVQQPAVRFHTCGKNDFYTTLFNTSGSDEFMNAFLDKYTVPENAASEEDIFTHNKLAYIQPALREAEAVLTLAAENKLRELIQPKDIKGIIHSHSTWSDGTETIELMAKAALDKGFEYLVISDHSQAAYYANGLTPERIAMQHLEIDAINAKLYPNFKVFKSIEADILGDGRLDYNESVLNTFDIVIASVHSNLKMSLEKAMDRVMAAIRNPFTTILGHPTGRLLLSREGYPLDHKQVIDACVEHNVVIEINAHPRRLDLDWRWIEYAIEKGVMLSVDPDAHSVAGFNDIYYGVMSAQKGGLTAANNLSSLTLKEFEAFVERNAIKKNRSVAV
jgi:DNA polymerase (family 10)